MIKVFFDQNEPHLIFTIAAILAKAQGNVKTCPIMVPINMNGAQPDDLDLEYINSEKYRIESGEEDILSDEPERIYILNIGPQPGQATDAFLRFAEAHQTEIVFWLDNHKWPADALSYANRERPVVQAHQGSILSLLEYAGHEIPKWWKDAEAALLAGPDRIATNQDAQRYADAIRISAVIDDNLQTNDRLLRTFEDAADEICHGHKYEEVNKLCDLVPKMKAATARAKQRIRRGGQMLRAPENRQRPIGYIDLGEIKKYYDLDEIMRYGLSRFPWMFIMYYRFRGRERLRIDSKWINIEGIAHAYSDTKNRDEIMRRLSAEVIKCPEPKSLDKVSR